MSAVADDITADFIIEAQEILDRLGEQLVSLEIALPDDISELAKRLESCQDTGNPRADLGV